MRVIPAGVLVVGDRETGADDDRLLRLFGLRQSLIHHHKLRRLFVGEEYLSALPFGWHVMFCYEETKSISLH